MSQTLLFIELLLVHYAIQTQIEVNCREDVKLMCPDVDFDNLSFVSVTWYKILNGKQRGIIRKQRAGKCELFDYLRQASCGEDYSLFMASVTPEDSGRYMCGISASVGGQNLNRKIDLTVHVCGTQVQATSMATVFDKNESTTISQKQVAELPVMWSVIGSLVVGGTKVILCLITIWVIHSSTRCCSTRRQQHTW